ncbi:MAG TPA: SDR family oxidoreductase [Candidatus Tectomicrobia bacterium]|nr:SDR family oxidoreductase [Candidatus Tectomicrobia bacterium]
MAQGSCAVGRIAEPADVTNVVGFLASEEACFITGQPHNVNGGLLFH